MQQSVYGVSLCKSAAAAAAESCRERYRVSFGDRLGAIGGADDLLFQ